MTTSETTQVAVRVPDDLLAAVDGLSSRLGLSRAEFMRRACAVYLAQTLPVIDDLEAGRVGPWAWLFGPRVYQTGDSTDAQMATALRSLAGRVNPPKGDGKGLFA
jgi:hypothetical protein